MVSEIIQTFFGSEIGTLTLLLLFIVFILLARKVIKIAMGIVWVAFISALFPLFLKYGFGMDITLNFSTFIYYITLGVGLYCMYLLAKIIYKLLGIFESKTKDATPFKTDGKKKT